MLVASALRAAMNSVSRRGDVFCGLGTVLPDHILSFAEMASRTAAHQVILCRKRCAASRLLARACHNATALTLIRPRTGMNPKPWFLR
jgi:hypothetical protein